MNDMRNVVRAIAKNNIGEAQKHQHHFYAKRYNIGHLFKEGDIVFARNLFKDDCIGRWCELPCKGLFEIIYINSGNTCIFKNKFHKILKKVPFKKFKSYNEPRDKCIYENL